MSFNIYFLYMFSYWANMLIFSFVCVESKIKNLAVLIVSMLHTQEELTDRLTGFKQWFPRNFALRSSSETRQR